MAGESQTKLELVYLVFKPFESEELTELVAAALTLAVGLRRAGRGRIIYSKHKLAPP